MMRRARRYIDVKRDSEDGKEQALSCRCLFLFVQICRSRWGTKSPEEAVITLSGIKVLYALASSVNKAGRDMSRIPAVTSETVINVKVLVFILVPSVLFLYI